MASQTEHACEKRRIRPQPWQIEGREVRENSLERWGETREEESKTPTLLERVTRLLRLLFQPWEALEKEIEITTVESIWTRQPAEVVRRRSASSQEIR